MIASAPNSPKPSPTRVVLVEDHAMVRELFAGHLKSRNLHVAACCATVAEGLEACRREKPDLVIVDWTLPDGTGGDLHRIAGPKLTSTRWIIVTANHDPYAVRQAQASRVNGFVVKRADLRELQRAVEEVLHAGLYFCPESSQLAVRIHLIDAWLEKILTRRDRIVLTGIGNEKNPKEIADELGVSPKTVQNCISTLKTKLGRAEIAGLVRFAMEWGLVPPVRLFRFPTELAGGKPSTEASAS